MDERFRIPENEVVLGFIERVNPSAHSDIASLLIDSARDLPDARWYCPDTQAYAYMALYTRNHRIFGLAYGMGVLAFRIPAGLIPEARAAGGGFEPGLGGDWIVFEDGIWSMAGALRQWCKRAHDYVLAG